jgi:hypothetical protein
MDMIFSVGALISPLILVCGAYLSIAYLYTSETTRQDDNRKAAKVIDLIDAARDRRTDFTIGFRYHQAPTDRKAA